MLLRPEQLQVNDYTVQAFNSHLPRRHSAGPVGCVCCVVDTVVCWARGRKVDCFCSAVTVSASPIFGKVVVMMTQRGGRIQSTHLHVTQHAEPACLAVRQSE